MIFQVRLENIFDNCFIELHKQVKGLKMRFNTILSKNVWLQSTKWFPINAPIRNLTVTRSCTTKSKEQESSQNFETVFSFPFVRHIATLNKMKSYHLIGASLAIPICGLLEIYDIFPHNSYLAATYIGITGGILLSLVSIPFNNTIGFLYISEDNEFIKISAVDFWGRRKDRIIPAEVWKPLLDMKPKTMDAIYLSPQLTDGTKYKLFVKFGKVLNSVKMGQVLD